MVLSGGEVVAQQPVTIRTAATGASALGATGAEDSGSLAGAALLALLLGTALAVGAGLRRRRA